MKIAAEQKRLLPQIDVKVKEAVGASSVAPTEDVPNLYDHLERIRLHGLELCIVMDHTGSMGPVIGAAKSRAVALIKRLQGFIPRFRAGLVTYDDGSRLRIPLTSDGAALEKAFRKVAAAGGGDYEEGVDKGVYLALRQEMLGWSRRAQRVIVVVGDAPPHDGDVRRLLATLVKARQDVLYDLPIVVHTVSTSSASVEYFPRIAKVGGGRHVTLGNTTRLIEQMILLTLGGREHGKRIEVWVREIEALRRAEKKPAGK